MYADLRMRLTAFLSFGILIVNQALGGINLQGKYCLDSVPAGLFVYYLYLTVLKLRWSIIFIHKYAILPMATSVQQCTIYTNLML